MRVVIPKLSLDATADEDEVLVLSFEHHKYFREVLGDLWQQANGYEGDISFLMDGNEKFSYSKNVEMIFNPMAIDCNDKKVLNTLFGLIKNISMEDCLNSLSTINQKVIDYLDQVSEKIEYSISYDLELDVVGLLKLYNVKLLVDEAELKEKIVDYIKLTHRILNKTVFIMVNLKQFFDEEDLVDIYKEVIYEKVQLIIVQANYDNKNMYEHHYVIDKDLCIIEL